MSRDSLSGERHNSRRGDRAVAQAAGVGRCASVAGKAHRAATRRFGSGVGLAGLRHVQRQSQDRNQENQAKARFLINYDSDFVAPSLHADH